MPRDQLEYYGQHFDARGTKDAHGDMGVLRGNFVNLSMPAKSTHFDHLMEIGRSSHKPFPIKFLSDKLRELQYPRGRSYLGKTVDVIRGILLNYPYLRWWMEEDGLVVDEVKVELGPLSDFDRVAGPLVVEHWENDKLSASSLEFIASRLDAEGFPLKGSLQPAQWEPIAVYNQKYSKSPIKTFSAALRQPRFVRSVRRRLYVARDRYLNALRPAEPIDVEI
jgi:hypothetical protein